MPALGDTGIFILGEIHDNPDHHAEQARLTKLLQPQALVFEMIEPAPARRITPELRADADRLEAHLEWTESGWPDFAMYYPIFAAAPEAAVYGGAVPREDVRRAVGEGAAIVFGDAAPLFALDEALPESELSLRLTLQQEAHCNALPDEMLPGMVEAQRLRDAAIARAAVAAFAHASALSDTPAVVVIAGNGHAREDWGVPALLRHYYAEVGTDAPRIVALGQFEEGIPEEAPYSASTSAPAPEREDPCLAFAK